MLEHIADSDNLVSFENDNADKTTDKAITYTPSEGVVSVDVLVVGGGGAGGFLSMSAQAVTAWGAKYCGGGGGGGGVLVVLGMPVSNNAFSTGWTTPVEITIDTAEGTSPDGSFCVGGTLTDSFAEPELLSLILYRKANIYTDSAGVVREGFGGLPYAVQTVASDAGNYSFSGVESGDYVLLAVRPGDIWRNGWWHADTDGRPAIIHVEAASVAAANISVGA